MTIPKFRIAEVANLPTAEINDQANLGLWWGHSDYINPFLSSSVVSDCVIGLLDRTRICYLSSRVCTAKSMSNVVKLVDEHLSQKSESLESDGFYPMKMSGADHDQSGIYSLGGFARHGYKNIFLKNLVSGLGNFAVDVINGVRTRREYKPRLKLSKLNLMFANYVKMNGGERKVFLFCFGTDKVKGHISYNTQCNMATFAQRVLAQKRDLNCSDWNEADKGHILISLKSEMNAGRPEAVASFFDLFGFSMEQKNKWKLKLKGITLDHIHDYCGSYGDLHQFTSGQALHSDAKYGCLPFSLEALLIVFNPNLSSIPCTRIPLAPFMADNEVEWRPWELVAGADCPIQLPTAYSPCVSVQQIPAGGFVVTSPAVVHCAPKQ
jgi:hypothetical protein